jgi:DNA-binding GntR family transcriptional regulator
VDEPSTKADEIALILEQAILSGELRPGTVLRQERLSADFGVSRTPIREALRKLAALELVDFAGRRGVQVRSLAQDELLESFTVRAALEGFAAELACKKLTRADLRRMRQAQKRFAALTSLLRDADTGDSEGRTTAAEWVAANADFHDVYLDRCGVAKLADEARAARRVFHGQALWSPNPELDRLYSLNLSQHDAIMDAFESRSTRVRGLVERHILDSGELLERALQHSGYRRDAGLGARASWSSAAGSRRS